MLFALLLVDVVIPFPASVASSTNRWNGSLDLYPLRESLVREDSRYGLPKMSRIVGSLESDQICP